MRSAFTLIELLVVMVIIVVIMGMVMPVGKKLLQGFESLSQVSEETHKLQMTKAYAFIEATPKDVNLSIGRFHISKKGVVHAFSNDDG